MCVCVCGCVLYLDPYVKIWMVYDGKKVEKKKTVIHQKTLNPVFNDPTFPALRTRDLSARFSEGRSSTKRSRSACRTNASDTRASSSASWTTTGPVVT